MRILKNYYELSKYQAFYYVILKKYWILLVLWNGEREGLHQLCLIGARKKCEMN
jgi:hypothetical protein